MHSACREPKMEREGELGVGGGGGGRGREGDKNVIGFGKSRTRDRCRLYPSLAIAETVAIDPSGMAPAQH